MQNRIVIFIIAISLTAGCAPSRKYISGGQFYSEHYTETQIKDMEAAKTVSVGHLALSSGGCGAFSTQTADKKFVIEPIKQKMFEMNALAVTNIRVSEKFALDFALGLLIIPTFAGCSNWNIEGDFFRTTLATTPEKPNTLNMPEKAIETRKVVSSDKPLQKDDSTRLEKLKDMRSRGLITQADYDKKRKDIIDSM